MSHRYNLRGGRSAPSDGFNRKTSTFRLKPRATSTRPTTTPPRESPLDSSHSRSNHRISSLYLDVAPSPPRCPRPTCISRRAAATSTLSELRTACSRASSVSAAPGVFPFRLAVSCIRLITAGLVPCEPTGVSRGTLPGSWQARSDAGSEELRRSQLDAATRSKRRKAPARIREEDSDDPTVSERASERARLDTVCDKRKRDERLECACAVCARGLIARVLLCYKLSMHVVRVSSVVGLATVRPHISP